ncbi:uncharacterized protein LOC131302317 [Rhododendron vialii]|uniref:uncharacterized protein LOC131302317 n=1 Tax=Rhododendron vialii TaxID=182163 RepID=UPI00265DABA0|nr:uncharacterized protein LOC131302317 [Rhododendron vialii]
MEPHIKFGTGQEFPQKKVLKKKGLFQAGPVLSSSTCQGPSIVNSYPYKLCFKWSTQIAPSMSKQQQQSESVDEKLPSLNLNRDDVLFRSELREAFESFQLLETGDGARGAGVALRLHLREVRLRRKRVPPSGGVPFWFSGDNGEDGGRHRY